MDKSLFTTVLRRSLALALTAAFIAGCGSLPTRAVMADSFSLPPNPDSPLVKIAVRSTPDAALSGVRLLPLGAYSLDARLELVQRATSSLDVQYFYLNNDESGRLLLHALRNAALRGVRVRLLLDDLYTGSADTLLRGLAAFTNVEIRLFNPFCCARKSGPVGRVLASLWDIGRLNHRMHNKLIVADGVMAVVGGRNIADEYFLRVDDINFVDMDALLVGSIIIDLSAIFDRYWNSNVVYPVEAVGESSGDAAARRAHFDATNAVLPISKVIDLHPVDVLGYGPIAEELDTGQLGLLWGRARALADPPEKLLSSSRQVSYETSVNNDMMMSVWEAKQDLVITSPYLIPGADGVKLFEELKKEGVKVTVVTNSLAATDQPLVHNAYAKYRERMLDAGVDLYELRTTGAQRAKRLGVLGESLGRLHAKTAVIDKQRVFVGSMNLDPRSASTNTEFGVFIDSAAVAKEVLRVISMSRLESSYRVRFAPNSRALQWLTADDEKEVVLDVEPESSMWFRIQNTFLGWFLPEKLL